MKGFDKLNVKSAVKSHSKMDLSRTHLTTMQFGQILPLFCEELVPGDQFSIDSNFFSRMAPLVKPTYGKFSFHTMSVFVPYYQLGDDVEAWLGGKSIFEGAVTSSRYIKVKDLVIFLRNQSTLVTSTDKYDFVELTDNGDIYCRLSGNRKYWLKILNCLGYAIPQGIDVSTGSQWMSTEGEVKLSALPLLAFCKAYNDWMSQSTRYNSSALTAFLKAIKHNVTVTGYDSTTHCIDGAGLVKLLSDIKLCYETDYFLSAWQYPNSPIGTYESFSGITLPNESNSQGAKTSVSVEWNQYDNNTVLASGPFGTLNQRVLDWLQAFSNWVRRNNYSGSRSVQQIYSRFGIKTADYRSNYAEVISTDVVPIQVGDVTSTATTEATIGQDTVITGLGDYAGKGIVSGQKGFSYKASDYGMLMVFGWFTVAPMNAYGFSKHCLRDSYADYYTPEFDGVGVESISYGELFANPTVTISDDNSVDSQVYGFTERYNSYRYGRDQITGEFRNFDRNDDMNVWHSGRLLTAERETGTMVAQSVDMNTLSPANSQFNRIFSIVDGSVDHFYLTCQFKVDAVRPMMSLNEVPRLGEGDTVVPRNGNVIN